MDNSEIWQTISDYFETCLSFMAAVSIPGLPAFPAWKSGRGKEADEEQEKEREC